MRKLSWTEGTGPLERNSTEQNGSLVIISEDLDSLNKFESDTCNDKSNQESIHVVHQHQDPYQWQKRSNSQQSFFKSVSSHSVLGAKSTRMATIVNGNGTNPATKLNRGKICRLCDTKFFI